MGRNGSSIVLLPVEILVSIFLELTPRPSHTLSRRHPCVLLSHVCHHWREVALRTPHLWSHLNIVVPEAKSQSGDFIQDWVTKANGLGDLIEVWVERSGQSPLTILVQLCDPGLDFNAFAGAAYGNIIRPIFACAKQWQEVYITLSPTPLPTVAFLHASNQLHASQIPILESFAVNIEKRKYTSKTKQTAYTILHRRFFYGASLRRVKLEGEWHMDTTLSKRVAKWAPLTEIEVSQGYRFSSYHALQLLESLPSLVKASFQFQRPKPGKSIKDRSRLVAPRLKNLSLQGTPVGPEFSDYLSLPNLKELSLLFDSQPIDVAGNASERIDPEVYGAGALALLRKFGDQLTTFAINPDVLLPSSYPSCLESLNSAKLESLSLIDKLFPFGSQILFETNQWTGRDAKKLLEKSDHAALLHLSKPGVFPNLRNFEMGFRNVTEDGDSEWALAEYLLAHMDPSRALGGGDTKNSGAGTGSPESPRESEDRASTLTDTHLVAIHITLIRPLSPEVHFDLMRGGMIGFRRSHHIYEIRLNHPTMNT
ncbi:hypothetical protein NMY22_g17336 [Coprinellus aureogranulatus]|nr:hypothetical protein NMY22_g17336 [Coprinellus aureogranulatus]